MKEGKPERVEKPATARSARVDKEEKILSFWKDNDIFKKTLEKKSPKGDFVFYEGPPTANGKPAIHHLEARAFKDAIPRYKTMRGYNVARKAGWDTHGLPVELEVEKQLGLKSKKEIEEYGIAEFNEKCRESVLKYISDWAKFTDRIGYWVNLDEAYFTYDNSYIEAVWDTFSHSEKRKLLYKDYKVVPWCPRCGTALSSHELAQGYKDVKDLSVTAKFRIMEQSVPSKVERKSPSTSSGQASRYLLAWTTTPWTLPGNVGLAVGEDIDYIEAKVGDEVFVLAKDRLETIEGEYEIIAEHKGKEMVGMQYEPLYPFIKEGYEGAEIDKAYRVYSAEFVNTEEGTGIVHTAVMYGQDDFELGTKEGLPKHHLVDEEGHFIKGTGFLEGRFVKDEETSVEIIKDLAHRGLLFKKEKYEHSYPHCWRCKTPLIYYARDSWYIEMSKLRDSLIAENKKINWEPDYIKEGRFGEWLREVKDWAVSRERYWGTPMPVWESESGERLVVSSIEEMNKLIRTSGNSYFLMRHGEAEHNVSNTVSSKVDNEHHLTEKGKKQVKQAASELKNEGINLIVASPFIRTKETAELVATELGLDTSNIIYDERLGEFGMGDFEGKSSDDLHEYFKSHNMFDESLPGGGENFLEAKRRLGKALNNIEDTYRGKNVLIVTHRLCGWLMSAVSRRMDRRQSEAHWIDLQNAEVIALATPTLPHNEDFELDLHRPYIDEVVLVKDGEEYKRVKEVLDVWFDSGSMPFAQDPLNIRYPADFISEAMDQTRGWFYTLHALGVLTERGHAYENVICLGLLLDKDGKKMSKSIGNVVDPWEMIEKHGVDVLRYWMYSVNQPGESKNFDEATVTEISRKVFNLLDNVYSFYDLYRDKSLESDSYPESDYILDKWILSRLSELIKLMTSTLDDYKLLEPTRALREFIDDLSTWYLRRSRDRIKEGSEEAKATLYYVLKTTSKLLAPFAPFASDALYQDLRTSSDPLSVHLDTWPDSQDVDEDLISGMSLVRSFSSMGLMQREEHKIKVRQPLRKLTIKHDEEAPKYWDLLSDVIKEELNVKEVEFVKGAGPAGSLVELDTEIDKELEEEGRARDVIRSIQDMRKEKGLSPEDKMDFEVPKEDREIYDKFREEIEKVTNVNLK